MRVPDFEAEVVLEESLFDFVFRSSQGDFSDTVYREILREDADYWRKAIKTSGIRPDGYYQ